MLHHSVVSVLSRVFAAAVLALGAGVLFGWATGHGGLKAPLPGFPAMKPGTALALVLAGGMCLACGPSVWRRRLGQACAAALLALALAHSIQGLWGLVLHLDGLVFRDDSGFGPPVRMPAVTAHVFVTLAVARLLLDSARRELRLLGALLSAVSLAVAAATCLAYLHWNGSSDGLPMLFAMAPHTALGMVLAACSLGAAYFAQPAPTPLSRQRRFVFCSFGLTAGLAVLAWAYFIWNDYADTRAEAATQAQNLVRLLSEHAQRSLDTPRLLFGQIEGEIERQGLQAVARSRANRERWRSIVDRIPQISSLSLLDHHGQILQLSLDSPAPGGNYAYRDYFKAHAAGVRTFIGPAIVAGTTGRLIFTYSRRLEDAQGRFAGVLLAAMDVAYYRDFFESLELPPGSGVGLLTTQGRFLVHEPMSSMMLGADLSGDPLFADHGGLASGTYVGRSPLHPDVRLFSFQRDDASGLVVVASLSMDGVTAAFERRLAGSVLVLLLVLAALGTGTLVQLRGLDREEQALAFTTGVLNSVAPHIAILDDKGRIVATNEAWNRFGLDNGSPDPRGFVGRNYFEICRAVPPAQAAEAEQVVGGIASVMMGALPEYDHTYRCDSPSEPRWFNLRVTPLAGRHGSVVVSHENITELKQAEEAVRRLAQTDPLTGLANRRAFFEVAEREVTRSMRYGGALAVIALDIDHFKRVNDTWGHEAGDEVLQALARALEAQCRDCDLVARFGGEEFVILLPETSLAGALLLAERVRLAAAALEVRHDEDVIRFTLSCGVAQFMPDREGLHELLARADRALYAAKEGGRNRVEAAEWLGAVA